MSEGGDAVFLARQGPAFDDVIVLAVPEPGLTIGLAITSLALLVGTRGRRAAPCLRRPAGCASGGRRNAHAEGGSERDG